jgi:hypothetical protein
MSGKKWLPSYKIFAAQAIAASTDFTSVPVDVRYVDDIAVQLNVTATAGSATGVFDIQGSLDYALSDPSHVENANAGTWVNLKATGHDFTISGADTNQIVTYTLVGVPFVRVAYTHTSGTGSVTGYISGKGI